MGDGSGELPLDKYAKYKSVPQLWYNEMEECGLTKEEEKVLEKYLKEKSGIADTQEVMMQLVMEPKISNFDMGEANKLRKVVSKKVFSEVTNVQKLYYDKGLAAGTRKELLDYVWKHCIALQLGYSFSSIHTTGYSLIAIQEMNLATKYPVIYWNCACLSVDSSAISESDFYNLIDSNIIEQDDDEDDEDKKDSANKMDYSRLATALDKFKNICNIRTPDINISRLSFTPDVKNNTIIYGLKGINRIKDNLIKEIVDGRNYKSLNDFLNKVTSRVATKDKIINLIKCGAFNEIEHKSTKEVLEEYINIIADTKKKLTLQNMLGLITKGLLPKELEHEQEVYLLTKTLRARENKDSSKLWYRIDQIMIPKDKVELWREIFKESNVPHESLVLDGINGVWVDSKKWDNYYKSQMEPVKAYVIAHQKELLDKYNEMAFKEMWDHYCLGDEKQWELDSLNFYFHGHPLEKVLPFLPYETDNINNIVEGASDGFFFIKGKQIPKMHLYTIAGTVIDKNKVKGTVTLQTVDGIMTLKLYKNLYSTMVEVLGNIDEESGEKEIEQDSFFEKGVHLLVTGILRGTNFIPKVYKNTGRKAILKINLDENGNFIGLEEKKNSDEVN